MQTIIENAQCKCMEASRLSYILKGEDRRLLSFAIKNVYEAIRCNNIPMLLERLKSLDLKYNNFKGVRNE